MRSLKPGTRVEFTRSPGRYGTVVSGPYTNAPWGSQQEPTYLVRGDNGYEGYRQPTVLRVVASDKEQGRG